MRLVTSVSGGALVLAVVASTTLAQDRGAGRLDQQIRGITVTPRVLLIGAHPDDEDGRLIAYLSRGHRVETAYLSLTRGESGMNVAGTDFGEVLGAVRTAEVLRARRIDDASQYFTRAFDFGFSRTSQETFEHWPHHALLGDVVTVIRSFRPHVIVSLFTGTPADSNGQHEVSAQLAREAFDVAADTTTFAVAAHGFPWEPLKLFGPGKDLTIDAGGYDPILGRTYTDIAAESRAQNRTQGFPDSLLTGSGAANRLVTLALIASRAKSALTTSQNIFEGIDTSFARLATAATDSVAQLLARVMAHTDSARSRLDLRKPEGIVGHLARAARYLSRARNRAPRCLHSTAEASGLVSPREACVGSWLDIDATLDLVQRRVHDALLAAAGVSIEMIAGRELVAYSDTVSATLIVANHGAEPIRLVSTSVSGIPNRGIRPREILADSVARWATTVRVQGTTEPWWFGQRKQDLYPEYTSLLDGVSRPITDIGLVTIAGVAVPENIRRASDVMVMLQIAGEYIVTSAGPIVFRTADPVVGVHDRLASGVPSVGLSFDHSLEWIPAGKPLDRLLRVSMRSYADSERKLALQVVAPPGIRVDSLPKSVTLPPRAGQELLLRLRGTLKEGQFAFGVVGRDSSGYEFDRGMRAVQYPHLPPVRLSRGSGLWLKGVDIVVPNRLNVAYLQGVGDPIASFFRQLGVRINPLGYDELLNADLSQFTTIVVGVRAYEARPELIAYNPKLLDFVRKGGTLVVQGGTNSIYSMGIFPYVMDAPPNGGVDRVTVESTPVTVLRPELQIFNWPNRITAADWKDWTIERATYMPRVIDPRYIAPLEFHDPGQPESKGALLMTTLGKGTYIYTTLSLHRQLASAVSGSARLFVNLLSAGLSRESVNR